MSEVETERDSDASRATRRRNRLRFVTAALVMAIAIAAVTIDRERVAISIRDLRVQPFGLALLWVIASYVAGTLLLIPGWLLTVATGGAFGLYWGTLAASIGSVCGAAVAFLGGRTVLRNAFMRRLQSNPRWQRIDRLIAERGFRFVVLLRLSPAVPFNLISYGLGVTRIRFVDYVVASWLAMLPGTVLYVYLGSIAASVVELAGADRSAHRSVAEQVLFGIGLVATIIIVVWTARIARREARGLMSSGPVDDGRQAPAA